MQQDIVLGQMLKLIPRSHFDPLAEKYHKGQPFRATSRWDQFVGLLIAQLGGQHSLREIDAGGRIMQMQLARVRARPSNRSTLARVNANQPWQFYEELFRHLLGRCQQFAGRRRLPVKRKIISLDSSTIMLCLELFPWAGYRFGKGAVKLHVGLEHSRLMPEFVQVTEGHWNDHHILSYFEIHEGVVYIFDRGYYDFAWYQRLTEAGSIFVTRPKSRMLHEVVEDLPVPKGKGVITDQVIRLTGAQGYKHPGPLRMIRYQDPVTRKILCFITNQFTWASTTIAALYKERWQVELFFKWLKQNTRIRHFVGNSVNALMTQIWIALITYLLLAFLKMSRGLEISLTSMRRVIRITLFERRNLGEIMVAKPPGPDLRNTMLQLELVL